MGRGTVPLSTVSNNDVDADLLQQSKFRYLLVFYSPLDDIQQVFCTWSGRCVHKNTDVLKAELVRKVFVDNIRLSPIAVNTLSQKPAKNAPKNCEKR